MSAPVDQLAAVLEQLVQATSPTEDAHRKRTWLIASIESALKHRIGVQDLRVQPYGSFVSQQYNASSDLDLALCGFIPAAKLKPAALAEIYRGEPEEELVPLHKLDKRSKATLLRDAGYRLQGSGVASRDSMEFVLHARVPIVKFADRATGIEVDLCLGNEATSFKAWSVARVAEINPAFGRLYKVVKLWAKAHGINDGASHMFNSWCLTLVVMYFLQQYPSREQALLPPLCELLYEERPAEGSPRLMQEGAELPAEVFTVMQQRASQQAGVYGARPCPPLPELFHDFVQQCGRNLRGLLAAQESFRRGTRISAFYGQLLHSRPFSAQYVLCVEDPYDDSDNTARTFGTWDGHPGTIHYVTSVFERTARRLERILGTGGAPSAASSSAASDAWEAGSNASGSTASSSTGAGPGGPGPGQPPPAASLASTLVFLFGPELVSKLPDVSRQLLGAQLHGWALQQQGRLPAGELHTQLLKALGAAEEFMCFESFKRRHNIRVLNEVKYTTADEKLAAALAAAAKRDAKKAKDAAKRAVKQQRKEREAAAAAASTAPAPTSATAVAAAAAGAALSRPAAAGHTADASAAAALAAAEAVASRPPRPNSRLAPEARGLLNRVVASTLQAGGAGGAAAGVQGRRSSDGHVGSVSSLSAAATAASAAAADALAATSRGTHHAAEPAQAQQPHGHGNQDHQHQERTRSARPQANAHGDHAGEASGTGRGASSSSQPEASGPAGAGTPRQPGNRRQQLPSGTSRQAERSRRGTPASRGGAGGDRAGGDGAGGDGGGGSSAHDVAAVQTAMQGLHVSGPRAGGGDAAAAGASTSADAGAAAGGAAERGRPRHQRNGGQSGRPESGRPGREGSGRRGGSGGEGRGGAGGVGAGAEAVAAAPPSRQSAPYFTGPRGRGKRGDTSTSGAAAAAQVLQ
ncbi:hypothetical protein HXX76_010356 [Chlamydomonas incerta]|uniref:Poly(A) RNA polymerase mitochondrial-like central palm domain-containing protein n=1 Tax=Chlamydomonas incerta TaxID=51695 RepID=A0A835VY78_CHLIN|nr:hypothetical protein HXX76_010356 [Chlamydomonas incerta]|eukprot:KAG2430258.1 hypothetical protein HXX76_010356 [Chlamydomonas incerta]